MNKKYFLIAFIIFVLWMAGSFLVHEILLASEYESVAHLYRSDADMQSRTHWMLLAHVFLAAAFTWIYARGVNSSPWPGQGLRYGIAICFLYAVPIFLVYYTIQPLPSTLVIKQIIFEGSLVILLGLVVAFMYKNKTT